MTELERLLSQDNCCLVSVASIKKALEQEPCEDAISRKEMTKLYNEYRPKLATHVYEFGEELTKLPSVQPKQIECEDAISRADAVKIANGYCHWSNVAKEFEKLPSVQPKYNASEWCKDCKEYDHDKHCCPRYNKVIRNAVEEMKQPKTGHWIASHIPESILDECSECGFSCGAFTFNYCPMCGAKMIEPQESEVQDADSD
jgi:hypothetical protein